MKLKFKGLITYPRIILGMFVLIILIGSLLLSLPCASPSGQGVRYSDALFTSVSATCVTGLVVRDTATGWSVFGQVVILCMIQLGGLGFMTLLTAFSLLTNRKINIYERKLIMTSVGALKMSGVVRMMRRVVFGTFAAEGAGAVLLSIRFCSDYGFWKGIYIAVFTSVSAFCNAGFDVLGGYTGQFSSLTSYSSDATVLLTCAFLVIIGGIGFFVWDDVAKHKFRFSEYRLHTKIVMFTTAALLLGGTAVFMLLENNNAFEGMSFSEKLLNAFFQSATSRTAGFNSFDYGKMSDAGRTVTDALMFVGGSPGSTAGGIKTTTLAVLLITVFSSARNREDVTVFKRRIESSAIRTSLAVVSLYGIAVIIFTVAISFIEDISVSVALFETVSAVGTVGLSLGLTPGLTLACKIMLMFLMLFGRVGGVTLALAIGENTSRFTKKRPTESIIVG